LLHELGHRKKKKKTQMLGFLLGFDKPDELFAKDGFWSK
jgi:hypothetical protein